MKSVDRLVVEIPRDIDLCFTDSGRIDVNPEFPICKAGYTNLFGSCRYCAIGYISCLLYYNKKGKEIKDRQFAHCSNIRLGEDIFSYVPIILLENYTGIIEIVPYLYINNIDGIYDEIYEKILPLIVSTYNPEFLKKIRKEAVLMDGSRFNGWIES